jgi:hypothetical protein
VDVKINYGEKKKGPMFRTAQTLAVLKLTSRSA